MKRKPRKKWKPTAQGWITALGLVNAVAVFTVASAADLDLPVLAIKWLAFLGATTLLVKGILEEQAREEARRLPPPKEPSE